MYLVLIVLPTCNADCKIDNSICRWARLIYGLGRIKHPQGRPPRLDWDEESNEK